MDAAKPDVSSVDQFLKTVERRALRMAEMATSNRDEAMDLVQDAMFGFVRHYTAKPAADWAPLFYRVLDSRINDWHRRRTVRGRWLAVWTKTGDDEDGVDEIAQAPDQTDPGPLLRLAGSEASHRARWSAEEIADAPAAGIPAARVGRIRRRHHGRCHALQ